MSCQAELSTFSVAIIYSSGVIILAGGGGGGVGVGVCVGVGVTPGAFFLGSVVAENRQICGVFARFCNSLVVVCCCVLLCVVVC